jgi:hypothetical protein
MRSPPLTRRNLVAGLAATAGLAIAGCGQARKPDSQTKGSPQPNPTVTTTTLAAMTVYRDPSCGCCEAWAGIARDAGYQVTVIDHPDMPAIKAQYGVPDQLLSCHTTIVGGYTIEGHVPLENVQRLLKARPAAVRGIAVAGMPLGSPGMEVPDGTKQPFRVMAFDEGGRMTVFRG